MGLSTDREGRLKTLRLMGGVLSGLWVPALFAPASVQAFEDFSLNNIIGTFHHESGDGVASFISRMEAQGRVNVLASELVIALHNRKQLPPSYTITVDDGYFQQMSILDILAKLGKKATFFVMGRWNGDGVHRYISDGDKRTIANSGVAEIGSHTDNHPTDLPALYYYNQRDFLRQIQGSKEYLESVIGKGVLTFAYPYGNVSPQVAEIVSGHYFGAFTTVPGNTHILSRSNILPRNGVN